MTEKPETFAEVVEERDQLRAVLSNTRMMLTNANREIAQLREQVKRLKAPRKLDPNAASAFDRPFR